MEHIYDIERFKILQQQLACENQGKGKLVLLGQGDGCQRRNVGERLAPEVDHRPDNSIRIQ